MEFYTIDNNVKEKTPTGDEFLDIYQEQVDSKGKRILKKIGQTNVYEKIQADKDNAVIYNIIEKYMQTGDESLLQKRNSYYGEFINMPGTPIELQNQLLMADRAFYELDKDVRAEFNNDAGEFKASIMNGSFEQRMNKFVKKAEPVAQATQQPTQTTEQGVNL